MNLVLIFQEDLVDEGHASLKGRRAQHITSVLRAVPGDPLTIGLLNGPIGIAHLSEIREDEVLIEFNQSQFKEIAKPKVSIILAMVRPQIMKRTLIHLASLGVSEIFLIGSHRVEKSYFSQRLFDGNDYKKYLFQGLEQAQDTWIPNLSIHKRFKPFIEDILPEKIQSIPYRFIAHPLKTGKPNRRIYKDHPVALAIGPEGGWLDYEVKKFEELGFTPLSFGRRILKVETSIPYLFGYLGL